MTPAEYNQVDQNKWAGKEKADIEMNAPTVKLADSTIALLTQVLVKERQEENHKGL